MKNFGCEYVVLEASSHALEQQRLFGMTCHIERIEIFAFAEKRRIG